MTRLGALGLLLLSCAPARLTTVEHELSVDPQVLDFGEVPVTSRHALRFTVMNRSRAAEVLDVSVDAPFLLAQATLQVPAGSSVEVQVLFAPRTVGAASGRLVIAPGVEVELRGVGLEPQRCETPWACWTASVVEATCVTEPRPDGTECAAPCLVGGTCQRSQCLGARQQCEDDGDVCTVESCDPQRGCLRTPRVCPAASDPCKHSRCQPAVGCIEVDADDGEACGEQRCDAARVCIAGACVTRAIPEGGRCGTAGVCHDEGHCFDQVCQATYRPLVFEPHPTVGTFVEAGGVQWGTWYASPSFSLRGLDLPATSRFDVTLPSTSTGGLFGVPMDLLQADGVVFSAKLGLPQATAFDAQSGAARWQQSPQPAFANGFVQLARAGDGALLVSRINTLSAYTAATGQPRWSVSTRGPWYGTKPLIGAAAGGAMLLEEQADGTTVLRRFSAQGLELPALIPPLGNATLEAASQGQAWISGHGTLARCPFDGGGCETFVTGFLRSVFEKANGELHWVTATPGADGGTHVVIANATSESNVELPVGEVGILAGVPLADGRTVLLTWSYDETLHASTLFVLDARDRVIEACPLRRQWNNDRNSFEPLLAPGRLLAEEGSWLVPGLVPLDGERYWVGRARNNQRWAQEAAR